MPRTSRIPWEEVFVTSANGASIQTLFADCCAETESSSPSSSSPPPTTTRLAFIAHPLGRLGGSFNDNVVRALAERLYGRAHGFSIVLMNARGVGASSGSPSFSAIPEAEDYESVVRYYVDRAFPTSSGTSTGSPPAGSPRTLDLLLCGYSAGSLSASRCFHDSPPPPSASCFSGVRVRIRHVLVSYPLSVLWALTSLRAGPFTSALGRLVARTARPDSHDDNDGGIAGGAKQDAVLSVRGTADQFTGDAKYRAWEARLRGMSGSAVPSSINADGGPGPQSQSQGGTTFASVAVQGADHFWSDAGHRMQLLDAVDEWLRSTE